MRRIVALFLTVLLGGVGLVLVASPASAATITTPTGDPFVVPGDAGGNPQPFTVSASGYAAGSNVFIEQCDGTPTTATGWDPTTNCDLGASPAAVVADAGGVATFPAGDPNYSFHPFKGVSPQGLFNCLAPGQASPANGLPDFTNCQFRVSTNNSASTSDQVFRTMTLPASAATIAPNFTGTPTAGTVGSPYSFAFTGITGSPAPTFALSPTPVAGGITISAAGVLSGTPTTAGSFPITVTASNGTAPNAVKTFTLVVNAGDGGAELHGDADGGHGGVAVQLCVHGGHGFAGADVRVESDAGCGWDHDQRGGCALGDADDGGFVPDHGDGQQRHGTECGEDLHPRRERRRHDVAPNFTGTPNGGTVGTPVQLRVHGDHGFAGADVRA